MLKLKILNRRRVWSETDSVNFELAIVRETKLSLSNDELCLEKEESPSQSIVNLNMSTSSKTVKLHRDNKYKHLVPLNELCLLKDGSITSVIGVVSEIAESRTITPNNKPSITIRNFQIVDQTKKEVNVAIWGKQAEDFNFKVGTILILTKCKISNYGGGSLSIQWETSVMEVLPEWNHIEIANELRIWWETEKNLISKPSLKRNISSDDVTEKHKK